MTVLHLAIYDPMIRKIIFTRPDGGVSVTNPVRNTSGETLQTDAEIEQRAWNQIPVDAINPQFVDGSVIPTDRTFRNAWVQSGAVVNVDLPKARDLQEAKIKAAQRLKIRDIVEREALGENVAAEKASVRAVNARALVDGAADVATLKDTFPEFLK